MKRTVVIMSIIISILALTALPACRTAESNWGSFTADRTESYDGVYYATQKRTGSDITVTVFNTSDGAEVFAFTPARASDFRGICWEKDTYNIWIQSGDIGVLCYRYSDGQWVLDTGAVRPDDIVSKYDQQARSPSCT